MKLSFSFQGYVKVDTDSVSIADGSGIVKDVTKYTPKELERALNSGDLYITLAECLDNRISWASELFDYEIEEVELDTNDDELDIPDDVA